MNKREIIISNYETPFNRGLKEEITYKKIKVNNQECIDEIELMIKIKDDIIEDIVFDGEACMIVIASTSILIKKLIGKTLNAANNIIKNYEQMINQEPYDRELLGDLIVFDDIYRQPSRITCALLAAKGIKKIINE